MLIPSFANRVSAYSTRTRFLSALDDTARTLKPYLLVKYVAYIAVAICLIEYNVKTRFYRIKIQLWLAT